jgi:soluble lytic murein transglycosylase-like protein
VDSSLVAAVIAQESAGNQYAVSRAGAKGLMQLIDTTARQLGVSKVYDPAQNIFGGAKYLRQLLDRFGGDKSLALASYNAGPGAVDRYQGIPPYRETQEYVRRVLDLESQFTGMNATTSKE